MIAHRLQTIQTAENLLLLESSNTASAAEKGTKKYEKMIDCLKKTNYAHQNEDDQEDEAAGK